MGARSFITLRQLTPRPWDLVSVYWQRLLQWARQKDVIVTDPDARVSEGMHGTRVVFEPRRMWDHPFRVAVAGREVSVRPGYVDEVMPTIGGIPLDGWLPDGTEVPAPVLAIEKNAKPGDDGRSFICLRMAWVVARGLPDDTEDDWLTVVHVSDLDTARREAGPAVALEPLAVCYWNGAGSEIVQTRQIVHHNLKHSWLPGRAGGTGRHFFSAV